MRVLFVMVKAGLSDLGKNRRRNDRSPERNGSASRVSFQLQTELVTVASVNGAHVLDGLAVLAQRQALHPQHGGGRRHRQELDFTRLGPGRFNRLPGLEKI